MTDELREFLYLDSRSINSLLASQMMAVPETVRDVTEQVEEEGEDSGLSGSIGYEGIAQIGGHLSRADSEQNRQLSETERLINDQYRFATLYRVLNQSNKLTDLNDVADNGSLELGHGKVIKANGNCSTDPFYRLLSAVTLLMRISQAEEIPMEDYEEDFEELDEVFTEQGDSVFEVYKHILHGDRIGLKLDPDEYHRPIVMSIGLDNLWVEPEREFLGAHDYTVVGRVSQIISSGKSWDFVDLLRIFGSAFSEESVDQFRDDLMSIGEELSSQSDDQFQIDLDIERDDYVVSETAIEIDPIAIYW